MNTSNTIDDRALAGPARRIFGRIAQAWHLTRDEQAKVLGIDAEADLDEVLAAEPLPAEVLQRISCAIGIFKAINTLLPEPARADAWVRKPNQAPLFGGRSALQVMTSGDIAALAAVRRYLDAQLA